MITIFKNLKINFNSKFRVMAIASLVFICCGIAFFFLKGPQLGLEFKGGKELIVSSNNSDKALKSEVQKFLEEAEIKYSKIRLYGDNKVQISIPISDNKWIKELHTDNDGDINGDGKLDGFCSNEDFIDEDNCLNDGLTYSKLIYLFDSPYNVVSYTKIGATISKEIKKNATEALLIAVLLISFYIIIRFDWYSVLGGVAALIHDVLIVTTFLMFFSYEFDTYIVAAFLIIIGYSLNDTIVVFDRIRENIIEYSNMKLNEIVNLSLNETLSRTLITSLTTLFVVVSVFIFGGESLKGSSFALIIGIVSGTYSSMFIAVPISTFLRDKYYKEEDEKGEQWQ